METHKGLLCWPKYGHSNLWSHIGTIQKFFPCGMVLFSTYPSLTTHSHSLPGPSLLVFDSLINEPHHQGKLSPGALRLLALRDSLDKPHHQGKLSPGAPELLAMGTRYPIILLDQKSLSQSI